MNLLAVARALLDVTPVCHMVLRGDRRPETNESVRGRRFSQLQLGRRCEKHNIVCMLAIKQSYISITAVAILQLGSQHPLVPVVNPCQADEGVTDGAGGLISRAVG